MTIDKVIIVINALAVIVLGFMEWRNHARTAKAAEALDWSTTAQNLRTELEKERHDNKLLREEIKILKDLTRKLIKEMARDGKPIILTPIEEALLYDTAERIKGIHS